ncbi:rhamnogalacturonide transporter RhiT [Melissococcus plutonius DAT561]|nr:rhamnogalacturonide transporter RhiT [Melissococcus plutonius DAT561]
MYLGCYISQDIFSQVFTYFIVFSLAYTAVVASNLLSIISIACIFGVLIGIFTISRFNPAIIYRFSVALFSIGILGFLIAYGIPNANRLWLLSLSGFVSGLGRGALAYIPWNIYSFIPDVDELVTGKRREGIFAGIMTFTRKSTQAVAVFLVGILLDHSGFIAKASVQSASATHTIVLIMTIGTFSFLIMGVIASFKFCLTKETHQLLIETIEEFRKNPTYQMDEQTATCLKQLTGWDQQYLWGNNNVIFKGKTTEKAEQN